MLLYFVVLWIKKTFYSLPKLNCKFYNTFVLVRDSGLCLFAEKSI